MSLIIAGCILSFVITLLVMPGILSIAQSKKLYDEPDDKRKLHNKSIPALGGVAIFIGFVSSIFLLIHFSSEAPEFQYYVAAFVLILFLGIKDDIHHLTPRIKLIGQVLAAIILVYKADLVIDSFHGFFGIGKLDEDISRMLTLFVFVVIINAFNLIDGVDGLAGSVGLIPAVFFASYFFVIGNIPYSILGFSLAGSLLGFLYYNRHPARIFMGDTGSLIVGLVNGILVIKFVAVADNNQTYPLIATPAIGFGLLLLPLMDTLRVFSIRIKKGKSPFSPDRMHFHHLLLNKGCNHNQVTAICVVITIVVAFLTFSLQWIRMEILLILQGTIFFGIILFLTHRKSKHNLRVVKRAGNKVNDLKEAELVPFSPKTTGIVKEE